MFWADPRYFFATAQIQKKNCFQVKPASAKPILFIEVSVVQAVERDGSPIYYNVEKLLNDYKSKFTKWCNNTGTFQILN
jgi:hypothetical protein